MRNKYCIMKVAYINCEEGYTYQKFNFRKEMIKMAENKKLNELEIEKVAGGSNVDEQGDLIKKLVDEIMQKHGAVCRECGKKYIVPDAILPAAYGDFSLCRECNEKNGLNSRGRKRLMEERLKKS